MSNPHKSPATQTETSTSAERNPIGRIGFLTSLTGVLAVIAVGLFGSLITTFAMCVAFVSLPGLVISGVGLFREPRRLAGWGVALGIFGSLYLPTFCLSLFHFK